MPNLAVRSPLVAVLTAAAAIAQTPSLEITAAVPIQPGTVGVANRTLIARPGQSFALLVDLGGGPVRWLGEDLWLALSPALAVVEAGTTTGVDVRTLAVPGSLPIGQPLWLQAVVLDPLVAQNGLFAASNGETLVPYAARDRAIVERFDDAHAEGFVGDFDGRVTDRLAGGALRRRVHSTIDPVAARFGQGIANPLNPFGSRAQMVFRPQDLGGDGAVEDIVALRWRPFGPVTPDTFPQVEILLGQTPVQPDYSIDPFTALPRFPNSGLATTFASNVDPARPPAIVFSGRYDIDPANLRADGYLPYPAITPFAWDGASSLLVEFRTKPSAALGINGGVVWLMVQSSPNPFARMVAGGRPGAPVDPGRATTGTGDCAMHELQVELVRRQTSATSPWRAARVGADYQSPYVAATVPAGTSLTLEFRGADTADGANATVWSTSQDVADGRGFLQFRATFVANVASAAVPAIDTLVIPYR